MGFHPIEVVLRPLQRLLYDSSHGKIPIKHLRGCQCRVWANPKRADGVIIRCTYSSTTEKTGCTHTLECGLALLWRLPGFQQGNGIIVTAVQSHH